MMDYKEWREDVLYVVAQEIDNSVWHFPVASWYDRNDPIDITFCAEMG
jgi:hypothetical protein